MAIVRQTLVYGGPGGPFEGVIAYEDEIRTLRPGVLVIPNVRGLKEADVLKAEALAKLGYVGFACDVFGQGKRTTPESPDIAVYMKEMNADRAQLRDRLLLRREMRARHGARRARFPRRRELPRRL